jgi:DNA-binding beta-propeller fold protein YncE
VSADGSRLYVVGRSTNKLTMLSTADRSIVATLSFGTSMGGGTVLSRDSSRLYVMGGSTGSGNSVFVVSTASNTVIDTVPTGIFGGQASRLSADGTRLYVEGANSLVTMSTSTDAILTVNGMTQSQILNGASNGSTAYAPYKVLLSPDERYAYVATPSANSNASGYWRIDLTTYSATLNLTTIGSTEDIALSPDGAYLYAAGTDPGTPLAVFNAATGAQTTPVP